MASPPNEPSHAGPDTAIATVPSNAEDITVRVDNASGAGVLVDLDDVYLDGEQDQEAGSAHSSSSEDVEIYLNDLGLDASGASGRVFGIQMAGMSFNRSVPFRFLPWSWSPFDLILSSPVTWCDAGHYCPVPVFLFERLSSFTSFRDGCPPAHTGSLIFFCIFVFSSWVSILIRTPNPLIMAPCILFVCNGIWNH